MSALPVLEQVLNGLQFGVMLFLPAADPQLVHRYLGEQGRCCPARMSE